MRPWPAALLLAALLAAGCERAPDPATEAAPPADRTADQASAGPGWPADLAERIEALDRDSPGELGVFLLRLSDDSRFGHDARRHWYLSSTVKVPIAIAVLQLADEGRLSLDEALTLKESDFVDGAGDLLWQEPGTRWTIAQLLEKSIRNSDSTATDMLLRRIGEDELARRIADWVGDDAFGPISTILDVRYEAYGVLHPEVAQLGNMDLVRLKNAEAGAPRYRALAEALGVSPDSFALPDIDSAFERYYESGANSATLEGFGQLLARLARGELLSESNTALLLEHMQAISTGDDRIAAGLPDDVAFAQKTGTQLARACNVGIVAPGEPRALVVAACVERFGSDLDGAERALRELGAVIATLP